LYGQHESTWGIKIVNYLFLAGMGAGALAVGASLHLIAGWEQVLLPAAVLGIVLVSAGSLFLVADLGRPLNFWKVLSNPASSMISIGAWILTLFLVVAAGFLLMANAGGPPGWIRSLSWASVVLALATASYTGVLLGVVKARPFWNNPLLPVLFTVSALSTGSGALGLVDLFQGGAEFQLLGQAEMGFILLESVMVFLYLAIMNHSTVDAMRSVRLVVSGRLALPFWGGVVGLGLFVPLFSYLFLPGETGVAMGAVATLGGGYFLRHTFMFAGLRPLLPGEALEASFLVKR